MENTANDITFLYVFVALLSYVGGIITGFWLRSILDDQFKDNFNGNTIVLIVVSLVWTASMIVDILSPTYETSPLVHGLMGAIVGFFYQTIKNEQK